MEQNKLPADIRQTIYNTLLNHSHASRTVASEEIADVFNKEISALQAKVERYEAALKMAECELISLYRKLGYKGSNILKEVSEALSAGEGEKEVGNA